MSTEQDFITAQLLAEHSKAQTLRLVHWVGADPERVNALMEIFMGSDYRLTQRGAWVVRYVGESHPEALAPWLPQMIGALSKTGQHDAVKRNVLNVFEQIDPPAAQIETLADIAFQFLENPQEPIAIRCAAMTVLARICRTEPDLLPALQLLLENCGEDVSKGMQSRIRKIQSQLSKPKRTS